MFKKNVILVGIILFFIIFLMYNFNKESYKITPYVQPDLGHGKSPEEGVQELIDQHSCNYSKDLLAEELSQSEKQNIIENHIVRYNEQKCDKDCDNVYIQQLYESYLIKMILEDYTLTSEIMSVYNKVFNSMKKKINKNEPGKYQQIIKDWVETEDVYFPVSQQHRDWSKYGNPYIMQHLSGIDHDYTEILLGGNFMKELSHYLPEDLTTMRDYSFNNILKRMRGYRTNQKNRTVSGDKNTPFISENQVGIVNFDFPDLELKGGYYQPKDWKHPGRSQCDTNPLQGTYQHQVLKHTVPLECGISGSTNFWLWTVLYSEVELTIEETLLLVLSAFTVLGADGGHSLNEVLASATINSMFWHYYVIYSKDQSLSKYFKSSFAKNLYKITKDINPLGKSDYIDIDEAEVANHIYNDSCKDSPKSCRYFFSPDKSKLSEEEIRKREELESFFTQDRRCFPFAQYKTFLDQLPQLNEIRSNVILNLTQYVKKYC